MRIELVGNNYEIRATPEEMLEHIAALTANVRNALTSSSGVGSSSRPIVATEDGQQVPRGLRTVIEVPKQ